MTSILILSLLVYALAVFAGKAWKGTQRTVQVLRIVSLSAVTAALVNVVGSTIYFFLTAESQGYERAIRSAIFALLLALICYRAVRSTRGRASERGIKLQTSGR